MKAWTNITHSVQARSRRARGGCRHSIGRDVGRRCAQSRPEHFPLMPLGGEPLQEGFVEVIHPNGPQVYTHHVYKLNGARSDQSYQVVISIWTSSLTCSGDPQFVLPSAVLVTNASGNGEADAVFDPELVAALGLRGLDDRRQRHPGSRGVAGIHDRLPGDPARLGLEREVGNAACRNVVRNG